MQDFDLNNRGLQLIDVQSKINTIFYSLNSNGAIPQISLDINGGYGEQNLAGLGLSDDLLESIQGDSEDNSNDSVKVNQIIGLAHLVVQLIQQD